MMKINKKLLPIKAHYFFFMAAMGPILPQLAVYGKELGMSPVAMGTITGILPVLFLIAKPLFGLIVDVYRNYRKLIFMCLIITMTLAFAGINFIPSRPLLEIHYDDLDMNNLDLCSEQQFLDEQACEHSNFTQIVCASNCSGSKLNLLIEKQDDLYHVNNKLCKLNINNETISTENSTNKCKTHCTENIETDNGCLYKTFSFWAFVLCMAVGSISFNVVNSISDAICFDVIGEEYDYGKQRVWGTVGFGITALLSGYVVDLLSGSVISYAPAFIVMLVCSILDLVACLKLKLPVIEAPENIFKDLKNMLNNCNVITFISFAVFAGILDALIIFFLFWYLEDLALATNTTNIKLIEGLIVAAETLGGEVLFFSISGKILARFGHVYTFSMCFLFYALRLGLISVAPNPWWIIPIEFCLQGPTYALTYSTIVSYADELAPPGTSATMQGIAAGMDDGIGFALGSFIGGFFYRFLSGKHTFQIFSVFGVVCSILHLVLHRTILKDRTKAAGEEEKSNGVSVEYKSPDEAYRISKVNA